MVSQITIPDISPAYQSHNPDSDDSSFPSERETPTMGVPHSTRSDSRFSVFSTDSSCNLVDGADHHPPRTALPFYLPSDTHRMVSQQDAGSQPTKCKNSLGRLCRGWRVIVLGSCQCHVFYMCFNRRKALVCAFNFAGLNVLLVFIPISVCFPSAALSFIDSNHLHDMFLSGFWASSSQNLWVLSSFVRFINRPHYTSLIK